MNGQEVIDRRVEGRWLRIVLSLVSSFWGRFRTDRFIRTRAGAARLVRQIDGYDSDHRLSEIGYLALEQHPN